MTSPRNIFEKCRLLVEEKRRRMPKRELSQAIRLEDLPAGERKYLETVEGKNEQRTSSN